MGDGNSPGQSSSNDAPEPISDNTQKDVAAKCDINGLFEAIRMGEGGIANAMTKAQSETSNVISRWRSNNGHGCSDLEQSTGGVDGGRNSEKYAFLVSWDGEKDPFCPRSRSLLHRWVMVLIVCTGSLCV